MTYAEIKAQLRGLINRSDMTDELAASFIKMAQMRLERVLRLSFMQKFVSFSTAQADGVFRVPVDYLELIDIFTDNGELERVDMGLYLKTPASGGIPRVFVQTGHDFRMRPAPATTDTVYLRYYAAEPALVTDSDTNHWTVSTPDALLYAAAEYAADHFEDERLPRFAERYGICAQELQEQQQQEDFSGPMRIQPAYSYPAEY
ncbi:phage adaptor protein [Novosphingobium sp. NPDC080210]|uniref:phage adaptor protein n=1 Tax=Novosphingobium sp. NPDC080210 TaxID=3390596 RepID=UPI003D00FB24